MLRDIVSSGWTSLIIVAVIFVIIALIVYDCLKDGVQ